MIPAPFDYEVAESVGNAIELLGSRVAPIVRKHMQSEDSRHRNGASIHG